MEKLKVIDNGQLKKIEYSSKYAKGIFLVNGKAVKRNCEILNINFRGEDDPLTLFQEVTKIGDMGIVSVKLKNEYYQYIFKSYAERDDVEQLINEIPPESKESLRAAYNFTKMNNMNDLSFLGEALNQKN